MNTTVDRIRALDELYPDRDTLRSRAARYSASGVHVAVVAEPVALEWCNYYLGPYVTPEPVCADEKSSADYVVHAVHSRAWWGEVDALVAGFISKPWRTYSGAEIREWRLGPGLYVQQYIGRNSFTLIDLERRLLAFVDDGASDPEWWMEPSRLVREVTTRVAEEHSCFVFHAASLAVGGQGVALIGPKRAGKTTLTIAALEYGKAAFISNDRTYVEFVDGRPYLHGWACTAALGIGTCLASPALRRILKKGLNSRHPQPSLESRLDLREFRSRAVPAKMQERVKIELTPAELGETFGVAVLARHELGALIMPRLDPSCERPSLNAVQPEDAGKLVLEQALTCDPIDYPDWLHLRRVSDEETNRRVSNFVDRLVGGVPAFELRYWDSEAAVCALQRCAQASCGETQ